MNVYLVYHMDVGLHPSILGVAHGLERAKRECQTHCREVLKLDVELEWVDSESWSETRESQPSGDESTDYTIVLLKVLEDKD